MESILNRGVFGFEPRARLYYDLKVMNWRVVLGGLALFRLRVAGFSLQG